MDAASLDDWNSTSTWGGSMYESYNSTGAMKSLYDLTQNREAHSQEEMNDLQNAADLYNALADVLKGMGYDPTGHSADEIKDYIVQYGSDEAINNLYTEMTNAGKVSGQATTTADKRAEIAGVTIESHTDADLEKHTDADLEKHTPEQSALYDALADALTKMGYDPTGHSADEIKDFITKYGSDATINSLYEEMAQAGKVSGKAATSADKRAEIAGVTIESHTDADLEQHSKEQIEALQNAAEAYDALRGALEGHYNGDASGLTDEQLLLEVLQNANMGEYEAVCNEVFAAYEQVFGQGSSKGKDVSTCLQEMVQKIVDLSKNIGTEEFKQAVVAVYKSFGMRYDNSKTPEENWNNLCKVMGWDAELESGNVDQDTPNPNFKERGE